MANFGNVARLVMACAGLVGLAGCQDSAPVTPEPPFSQEATAFVDNFAELESRFSTTTAAMPTSGTASFQGQSGLVLTSAGGDTFLLLGDAAMLADFQSATLDGTMGSFRGVMLPGGTGPATADIPYSGTILLQGGDIGFLRANDFFGGFDGTLTGGGNAIFVTGGIYGEFKGTPIRGIIGSASPGGLTPTSGTINGVAANEIYLDFWAK